MEQQRIESSGELSKKSQCLPQVIKSESWAGHRVEKKDQCWKPFIQLKVNLRGGKQDI